MTPTHGTADAPTAPAGAVGAPRLADGVELLGELSGSGYQDAPTLVRRADGQTLQVTPVLAALISLVDGRRQPAELATALTERLGRSATAQDVQFLLEEKAKPLGLLYDPDGEVVAAATSNPLLALRFKVVASTPEVTRRITAPFAWLFRSAVVVPVLVAFAFVCWWVLVEKGLASATRSAFYDPPLLLAVLGLTVLSAGLHEFGHAAACRYGGATPGAMGAGLYIVWPAFYTNVDDSYRLSRWGRLRVDLGGLYFNALIAVGVAGWWWATRQDALLLGVATQLLQMLRQLAPYVRADGYHILADLTGVPDLFAHMKPTLLSMLPWRWGKPSATPLKRWARVVVVGWVLLVVPVLLAMFAAGVLLLPRLVSTAWDSAGRQWISLNGSLDSGDVLGVLARCVSLVALVLPIAAVSYMLIRMMRRVPVKVWRDTDGKPVARLAATLAGVVLMAGLGWAWWPEGQYRPVQASERGTLGNLITRPQSIRQGPTTNTRRVADARTAYALIPRSGSGDHPSVLFVENADGSLQSIYTDGSDGGADSAGRSFPFALPAAPGEGDNQALAVNDADGSVKYDVAVALVWVTDGKAALNTNSAYALASCQGCTTVAVGFQVVLVVGQTDVVAPTNAAVAANDSCIECSTAAIAVQLVVTLREMPDEEVKSQIQQAMAKLDGLDDLAATLDVKAVYAQVKAVEAQVLGILVSNNLVENVDMTEATASPSASASSSASASASASSTASSEESASASPSGDPSSSPSPSESTSPSPSGSPSESPSPSDSPSSAPTP